MDAIPRKRLKALVVEDLNAHAREEDILEDLDARNAAKEARKLRALVENDKEYEESDSDEEEEEVLETSKRMPKMWLVGQDNTWRDSVSMREEWEEKCLNDSMSAI